MPTCLVPKCQREDLPLAPGFPNVSQIACAHPRPDGEPCHPGSPHGTYDEELLALVVEDDAMWDPEFLPEDRPLPNPLAAPPRPVARPDGKPRAALVPFGVDLKRAATMMSPGSTQPADGDQAATGAVEDAGPRIDARVLTGSNPVVDPPFPPAKPAKPTRKRVAKKAPHGEEEADDIDRWDP